MNTTSERRQAFEPITGVFAEFMRLPVRMLELEIIYHHAGSVNTVRQDETLHLLTVNTERLRMLLKASTKPNTIGSK